MIESYFIIGLLASLIGGLLYDYHRQKISDLELEIASLKIALQMARYERKLKNEVYKD